MKSKEKKAFRKLLVILILAVVGAIPLAIILLEIRERILHVDGFMKFTYYVPAFLAVIHVVLCIVMFVKYRECKKHYKYVKANEDDEEAAHTLEVMMDSLTSFISFVQIFIFLFFSIVMYISFSTEYMADYTYGAYAIAINDVCFVIIQIEYIAILRGIVNIQKEMTPGKKGVIFDFGFTKQWNNSLDEGEKATIYEAGYAGFYGMIITCCIMWVITYLGMIIFETGIFPTIVVSIIWFVGVLQYRLKLKKLKRK